MAIDDLSFEIHPRFYITCLYTDAEKFKMFKQDLTTLIEKNGFYLSKFAVTELEPFNYRKYKFLGYISLELDMLTLPAPDPANLFDLTKGIEELCNHWNQTYQQELLLDTLNPPYAVNLGVKMSVPETTTPWTKDNILKYKKPLGRWIEFYSGQWPDYSDELYLSRVANNLSNRLSEVHFIRTNSAFIYMPLEGFERHMLYMNKFFIEQILRVRALLFSYYLLNGEIDEIDRIFPELKEKPLKEIEEEIEKVEDLDRLIQNLASRVFSERIVNRRAHGRKVLETSYELFQIELTSTTLESKIDRLRKMLQSERDSQQTHAAQQQKRWILVLNVLLGSQIIFTLRDRIVEQFGLQNSSLEELMNTGLIGFVFIVVVVAVVGLAYTWLNQRIDFSKWIKKT